MPGANNFDSYARLKKDLLFHERRMQLLLGTRVVEDLGGVLREKLLSRDECASDCRAAIERFEAGAAEARLTGRWDELRVASVFGLEVPLNVVVGSARFEAPSDEQGGGGGIVELMDRVQAISTRFPEFSPHPEAAGALANFEALVRGAQWTPRDVARIKEAITAKLQVLSELNKLSDALQETAYSINCEATRLEQLRREEERAEADGEAALADGILREKLATVQKLLDMHFFQIHTVESSVNSNVTKRRSNLAVFQSGAAMLECLRNEKRSMVEGCAKDLARIRRGLQYEDRTTGDERQRVRDALQASLGRIKGLDDRQRQLSARLQELFRDFSETELALEQVGAERAKAVEAHVELVESSRHATSDYHEMARFAEIYADNLDRTREEYTKGIAALEALERLLLQQRSFDTYDFSASAQRLATVQRRVCLDLNRSLNDFEALSEDAARRYEARLRKLDEEIESQRCEVELRKEMFDPATKKHVMQVRDLEVRRETLVAELNRIRTDRERHREACMEKLRAHLTSTEIVDISDVNATRTTRRREDLLDMRQSTLVPEQNEIVAEREALKRLLESHKAASAAGEPAACKSLSVRRTTASRVASLRDDVERYRGVMEGAHLLLPAPSSAAAEAISDSAPADASLMSAPPDVSRIDAAEDTAAPASGPPADSTDQRPESDLCELSALEAERLRAIRANAAAIEERTMTYRKKARTIS